MAGLSKAVQRHRTFVSNRTILAVTVTALLVAAVVAELFIRAVATLGAMILTLLRILLEVQLAISQNSRWYD